MDSLFAHFCTGLAAYPVSIIYWVLYWYIQPSDPNSLKIGSDIVTGKPVSRNSYMIKYAGFVGSCIIAIAWGLLGNYYAKHPYFETDLLAVFHWSESSFHAYLYFWFIIVIGMISFAWYTAKILVSRKKWTDDPRRLY